jgi:ribosomal protein L24
LAGKWQSFNLEKPPEAAGIIDCVKPIRTDFKGYEGKYVATDTRTGKVVIADEDLKVVLEKARQQEHVVVGGRVPHADEPIYVGLG